MKKIHLAFSFVLLSTASAQATVWCDYNVPNIEESAVVIHHEHKIERVKFGQYNHDTLIAHQACEDQLAHSQCVSKFISGTESIASFDADGHHVNPATPDSTVYFYSGSTTTFNSLDDCQLAEAKSATLAVRSEQRSTRKAEQIKANAYRSHW